MAYKKTNTRKTLKRRPRRRFVKKRRIVRRVPRGPFPTQRIAKLKLSTGLMTFNSTSGSLAGLDVYANWPIYGTRNAYGWDQWAALYNRAVVIGSKIQFYTSGVSSFNAMGGIYLSDDTTNFTDYQDLVEANKGKMFRLMSNNADPRKCSHTFSAKKFFNIKDVKDNMDRLGNAVTSSTPPDAAIFKTWIQPVDKYQTGTLYATAVISYIVLFSEPKDVPNSA